jgi:hypothetical protein
MSCLPKLLMLFNISRTPLIQAVRKCSNDQARKCSHYNEREQRKKTAVEVAWYVLPVAGLFLTCNIIGAKSGCYCNRCR